MMTIQDTIVEMIPVDEGVGNGRYKLRLGQGAIVDVQGGSPAHELSLVNDLTGGGKVMYNLTLNTVGCVVKIERV